MLEYIIVQAGGRGTRLGYLTKNKPKALAPIENLPMLFHLFRKYPEKKFLIIADYQKDVLKKYLKAFAEVDYQVVDAVGTGTCSGVRQSIDLIPENRQFMLIWSDLILPVDFELPYEYSNTDVKKDNDVVKEQNFQDKYPDNYLGLSVTFPCRWKYENDEFSEERSLEYGVAGFFLFRDKQVIKNVPESGELVRWMQNEKMIFKTVSLAKTREFGLLEEYEKLSIEKTRPFNRITIDGDILVKKPVDIQGQKLAIKECAWYRKAVELGVKGLPQIYSYDPLTMEFISGKNIYECNFSIEEKRKLLFKLITALKELHSVESIPCDHTSIKEAYYDKTIGRLEKIEHLVPFAGDRFININGRKCRNVFFYKDDLKKRIEELAPRDFKFIHGDCTFSNLMIRSNLEPVFIDPRGYFGFTELYGDERYDWAKLYYSIVGNYDRFNLKRFSLDIGAHSVINGEEIKDLGYGEVRLSIESNGWEELERDFYELTGADEYEIKLIHAVIWLSLTTYAWQDFDSICGAFYNGLYYLEEVL